MSISRRELLAGAAALVNIEPALAEHLHQAVAEEKKESGAYKPKCFTDDEYKALARLAGLIIPADEHSPGALAGGAPEFIDLLASQNDQLAAIYTGGLAWLDNEMRRRYGAAFVQASPVQQTAMLDLLASSNNAATDLAPGVRFFAWTRKMVVDAFFTSKPGIEYLGYQGNGALAKFEVPEASLQYALTRSGLA